MMQSCALTTSAFKHLQKKDSCSTNLHVSSCIANLNDSRGERQSWESTVILNFCCLLKNLGRSKCINSYYLFSPKESLRGTPTRTFPAQLQTYGSPYYKKGSRRDQVTAWAFDNSGVIILKAPCGNKQKGQARTKILTRVPGYPGVNSFLNLSLVNGLTLHVWKQGRQGNLMLLVRPSPPSFSCGRPPTLWKKATKIPRYQFIYQGANKFLPLFKFYKQLTSSELPLV